VGKFRCGFQVTSGGRVEFPYPSWPFFSSVLYSLQHYSINVLFPLYCSCFLIRVKRSRLVYHLTNIIHTMHVKVQDALISNLLLSAALVGNGTEKMSLQTSHSVRMVQPDEHFNSKGSRQPNHPSMMNLPTNVNRKEQQCHK
jgi:hypothetical protein